MSKCTTNCSTSLEEIKDNSSEDFKTNHTFCPKLWEEFFIVEDGAVFPCCERPEEVGNLYHNTLTEICNSKSYQQMREDSLNGKLKCYKNCRLLNKNKVNPPLRRDSALGYKIKPNFNKKSKADYNQMKKLRMLFSEKCNLNCVMCHQNSDATQVLSMDVMRENIDLTPFESIDSQGGESLFIKEANQFFDHATSQGKRINLITNCTLVNDVWAKKIARHSDFVHISLNANNKKTHEAINRGSNWEKVLENIQKIKTQKKKLGTDLNIIGHMTILLRNMDELPDFIKNYEKFGFDTINFGYTRSVQYYMKANPLKRKALGKKVREVIGSLEHPENIDALRLVLLGLINPKDNKFILSDKSPM